MDEPPTRGAYPRPLPLQARGARLLRFAAMRTQLKPTRRPKRAVPLEVFPLVWLTPRGVRRVAAALSRDWQLLREARA
jgi:hypothetical protein